MTAPIQVRNIQPTEGILTTLKEQNRTNWRGRIVNQDAVDTIDKKITITIACIIISLTLAIYNLNKNESLNANLCFLITSGLAMMSIGLVVQSSKMTQELEKIKQSQTMQN